MAGADQNGYRRLHEVSRLPIVGIKGFEGVRLVKVGKGLHYIDENSMVVEKATGQSHPEAEWLVDVKRA